MLINVKLRKRPSVIINIIFLQVPHPWQRTPPLPNHFLFRIPDSCGHIQYNSGGRGILIGGEVQVRGKGASTDSNKFHPRNT